MKSTTASILAFVGFLLAFGGVGGMENSVDNLALLQSLAVSIVGMMIMWCGVSAMNVSEYYD